MDFFYNVESIMLIAPKIKKGGVPVSVGVVGTFSYKNRLSGGGGPR